MYASVYSEMKPHPTRCAAGDSGSSAASVRSVLQSVQPGGGRQMRAGGAGYCPGTGNAGHALPDHHISHHTW